jgi:peptidoglycan/xylan/chitin deacetylase (PgdA/CDA1 family)
MIKMKKERFAVLFSVIAAASVLAIDPVVKLCQSPGMFAMTFDQGPSIYTGAVLDAFDSRNVKATFHPIVTYLSEASVVANLQRAAAEGHTIGMSLEANLNLADMTEAEVIDAVHSRAEIIEQIVGFKPVFLRIPNYKDMSNEQIRALIAKGYIITTYNLDSYDYSSPNVLQSYKNVLDLLSPNTKGAFISVQRDYIQDSANATPDIIDYIMDKGYTIVPLDKCVRNAPVKNGPGGNTNGGGGASGAVPKIPKNPAIGEKTTTGNAMAKIVIAAPLLALLF